MNRLSRAVVTWLLLMVVPLQGYAAAAMVFCGATHGRAAVSVVERADHAHAAHARDGANHHHAAAHSANEPDASGELANVVHEGGCSVCASCCSGAALPASTTSACFAQEQASPSLLAENVDPGQRPARVERPPRSKLA